MQQTLQHWDTVCTWGTHPHEHRGGRLSLQCCCHLCKRGGGLICSEVIPLSSVPKGAPTQKWKSFGGSSLLLLLVAGDNPFLNKRQ